MGTPEANMQGEITLTYFDLYGKAEAIRMLLTHSKTPFTDNRVTGDAWAAFKVSGKCANGQVPVLEVGDRCLNQSAAILRFIGSQTGHYGPDPFDAHFADSIVDTLSDVEKAYPKGPEGKPLMYKMFGDKPNIGDFWLAASLYSWERNTKGKEMQAHVYAAHAAAFANNAAPLVAWADLMGEELKDYLEARGGGSL